MSSTPDALAQAIEWSVRLNSGHADDRDRAACLAWRGADPRHEQAWRQVDAVDAVFRDMPARSSRLASQTMNEVDRLRSRRPRRRLLKLLGIGTLAVGAAAAMGLRGGWPSRATIASRAGERRQVTLDDGTRMRLNVDSEVDATFSFTRRLLALSRGEIEVQTGPDERSWLRRPLWIECAGIRLQPIGTRFVVRRMTDDGVQLHVIEGQVAIHSGAPGVTTAKAGETFVTTAGAAPQPLRHPPLDPGSWVDGVLIARRMPVDEFVSELARYSRIPLRTDPSVGALKVSGVFQLDGPEPVERALQALAASLPVRVQRRADGFAVTAH